MCWRQQLPWPWIAKLYENVQHDDVLLFMDLRALLQGSNGAYPPANFPAVHCYECGRHSPENSPLWCIDFIYPWCPEEMSSEECGTHACGRSWCEHGSVHVVDGSVVFDEGSWIWQFELGLAQLHWMIRRLHDLRARAHKGDVNGPTKCLFESLPAWDWHPSAQRSLLTIQIRGETCGALGHYDGDLPASSS